MSSGPLLLPAGVVVLGVELGLRCPAGSPLLASALLASGLALGGRAGVGAAMLALGLLSVWVRPPTALEQLETDRVVAVEGRRLMPWRREPFGWSAPVRAHRIRQGHRVEVVRTRLHLVLGDEPPPAGRRLRARGYLNRSTALGNGGRSGPAGWRLRVKSARLIRFSVARDRWLGSIRGAGREAAADSDGVALARALALGDRSELRPGLVRAFRRAGLGHLLALSGLHVGILAGVGLGLGRLGLGRFHGGRWQWLVPGLAAVGFLLVVGSRPAVLRATLMALATWAALARGARPLAGNALAGIAAVMVVCEPELLRSLGFLLTVAATAGILAQLGSKGEQRGRLAAAVGVSAAAQLFTLPWTLPVFHLAAPGALIHNLWAVPWTAVLLLGSLAWLALAVVWSRAAAGLRPLLEVGAAPFRWVESLPAGPWWSVPMVVSRAEATIAAAAGVWWLRRRGWGGWRSAALLGALVAALALGARALRSAPEDPELIMLDVGQGEAILLRDRREAVLVDGGGWVGSDIAGRVLVPSMARLGVRRLRALVLTHPDLDHCQGLAGLASYLPVDEIWASPGWPPDDCLLDLLAQPGVRWRPVWAGWRGAVGRWRLRALSPAPGVRGGGNDRSLVLEARARGLTALLTGDIESQAERSLIAAAADGSLGADLLKVPHHGSRSSSGEALVEAVAPRLAWISAGRANRYGHPHPSVTGRLAAHGVRVLRTDRDGLLHLRIDRHGGIHLSTPGAPKGWFVGG